MNVHNPPPPLRSELQVCPPNLHAHINSLAYLRSKSHSSFQGVDTPAIYTLELLLMANLMRRYGRGYISMHVHLQSCTPLHQILDLPQPH